MEILKVENLTKVYGKDSTKVVALDHVSFSVEKGEFVAIVGASGSGKSTLLHLIGGVDRPTSGKVYVNGQDIYKFDDDKLAIFRRRQVGLIYQFYNLIPILNVEENITLPLALDGRTPDKTKSKEFAEKAYKYAQDNTIAPIITKTANTTKVVFDDIDLGYYLVNY